MSGDGVVFLGVKCARLCFGGSLVVKDDDRSKWSVVSDNQKDTSRCHPLHLESWASEPGGCSSGLFPLARRVFLVGSSPSLSLAGSPSLLSRIKLAKTSMKNLNSRRVQDYSCTHGPDPVRIPMRSAQRSALRTAFLNFARFSTMLDLQRAARSRTSGCQTALITKGG